MLAIIIGKALGVAGRIIGRGSCLPGKIALKICPQILTRLKLPPLAIAVTGSNGKTSTVEMISHILFSTGHTVLYNKEGSNQTDGVATTLLRACTFGGRVKADVVLFESDERYARFTFKEILPTHFVITNLFRDQISRNGHPEHIFNLIEKAITGGTCLILNGDDPLVALFGKTRKEAASTQPQHIESVYVSECGARKAVFYGSAKGVFSNFYNTSANGTLFKDCPPAKYDDGAFCPNCKHPLNYQYRHYAHIGSYSCGKCNHSRPSPNHQATALLEDAVVLDGEHTVPLTLGAPWEVENILAAYTTAATLGIPPEAAASALRSFTSKAGRVKPLKFGSREGKLFITKHENSQSYNLTLKYLMTQPPHDILIYVNSISRKYYTSEVSWLWDIDFEMLKSFGGKIYIAGQYALDLAYRFLLADLPDEKYVVVVSDLAAVIRKGTNPLNILTCFSDREGLIKLIEGEV